MFTSDCGPDMVHYRKLFRIEQEEECRDIRVDANCSKHQCALIVKAKLVKVDSWADRNGTGWKFFGSIAKLMHILRDYARPVFLKYTKMFQARAAKLAVGCLFPRCIAGRWGSMGACLTRLQVAETTRLRMVLRELLDKKIEAEDKAAEAEAKKNEVAEVGDLVAVDGAAVPAP